MLSALRLACIPAVAMLLMSAVVFVVDVPKVAVRAMQHLAAGIVLSAVAVELVPIISDAPSDADVIAGIVVGFTCGVGLFLTLAKVCPEASDPDEPDDKASPMLHAMLSLKRAGSGKVSVMQQAKIQSAPAFPFAFTVAVLVDSAVDGMLIGLSSAAGASAGFVMALALAIEMGFLGLTYSSTMQKQPLCISLPCLVAAPALLVLGAGGGAGAAAAVSGNLALHTGLVSFGIASLLYLVTEELLLEAHEGQTEDHVWYVDIFFFVGFLASFLLEKFSDAE